jgi:hypothetical protein
MKILQLNVKKRMKKLLYIRTMMMKGHGLDKQYADGW